MYLIEGGERPWGKRAQDQQYRQQEGVKKTGRWGFSRTVRNMQSAEYRGRNAEWGITST